MKERSRGARGRFVVTLATAALLMPSAGVDGQVVEERVRIGGSAGWWTSFGEVGRFDEGGETVRLEMGDSWAIGGEGRFPLSGDRFQARVHGFIAPGSELNEVRVTGFEPCGENCFRPVEEKTQIADATALGISGDVIFRILPHRMIEPYVWLGGGIQHFSFDGDAAPSSTTDPVLDFGVGLEAEIGGVRGFAEVGGMAGRVDLEPDRVGPDPDEEGGVSILARLGVVLLRF